MTGSPSSPGTTGLPVDPDEQRMFDELRQCLGLTPLEMVANQLHVEYTMAPNGGSYRALKAIAYNAVRLAAASTGGVAQEPKVLAGWVIKFNDERCFYWERGVAEWKADEFADKHKVTVTIEPVFFCRSPELSSTHQSAPARTGSLPSGESDPSVTLDYAGAGTIDLYAWPIGCHSPNSCHRNGRCMYVGCKHDGKDIPALAALAIPSTPRGDAT